MFTVDFCLIILINHLQLPSAQSRVDSLLAAHSTSVTSPFGLLDAAKPPLARASCDFTRSLVFCASNVVHLCLLDSFCGKFGFEQLINRCGLISGVSTFAVSVAELFFGVLPPPLPMKSLKRLSKPLETLARRCFENTCEPLDELLLGESLRSAAGNENFNLGSLVLLLAAPANPYFKRSRRKLSFSLVNRAARSSAVSWFLSRLL